MVRDIAAVIMVAIGDDRIAVIPPGQDHVQLVAALRTHLLLPEIAGGIEGDAEQVAVAVAPHRRVEALVGERIAGRRAALGRQAQDLAQRELRILGGSNFWRSPAVKNRCPSGAKAMRPE
jgi:hypothetical protein